MVRSHTQGLDKELDGFVNAVLIVETKTTHIECIRISGVHAQNITERKQMININVKGNIHMERRKTAPN